MRGNASVGIGLAVMVALGMAGVAGAGIVPSDIVAWYGLAGDAQDNSANAFHGVNNGATFVADGVRGTVASFDGTSSSINVSASGYSVTEHPEPGQFAISFWTKPTARQDYAPGGAIDVNPIMGGTGPTRGVIEIVGDSSWGGMGGSSLYGGVGANSGGGAGSTGKLSTADLYDGDWHHVLIQWVDPDGTVAGNTAAPVEVYVDGTLADVVSGTYNGNNGNTNPIQFVLGGPVVYSNGGAQDKYYDGLLSDTVFFSRQLTAAEVGEAMRLNSQAPSGEEVPEPATMALLGLAACGLGGYVRKRRRA